MTSQNVHGTRLLTTITTDQQQWLLLEVTLPETAQHGVSQTLSVHAHGVGDEVSTHGNTTTLPETGFSLAGPLLLALVAFVLGILLARYATWRKARKV